MKKLALAASIFLIGRFAIKLYLEMHAQILVERFPDLPETAVRKAHAEMLKRALRGELDADSENEEEMDAYLRALVKEQSNA